MPLHKCDEKKRQAYGTDSTNITKSDEIRTLIIAKIMKGGEAVSIVKQS